jgi:hypothetical protein
MGAMLYHRLLFCRRLKQVLIVSLIAETSKNSINFPEQLELLVKALSGFFSEIKNIPHITANPCREAVIMNTDGYPITLYT